MAATPDQTLDIVGLIALAAGWPCLFLMFLATFWPIKWTYDLTAIAPRKKLIYRLVFIVYTVGVLIEFAVHFMK